MIGIYDVDDFLYFFLRIAQSPFFINMVLFALS